MVQKAAACLLGALVADAASLGLHWIYDVERIAQVVAAQGGKAAFAPIDPANYQGVAAYFAHGSRRSGMLTHTGEPLRLMIRSMNRNDGAFVVAEYQQDFVASFGAGGSFQGYIDGQTRGTLANIAEGQVEPSGIEDDQLPAVTRLPAIVLAYRNADDFAAQVTAAVQVTSVHPAATGYGMIFADLLVRVLGGQEMNAALRETALAAGEFSAPLLAALDTAEADSVAYGEVTERACPLPMAMPLMYHMLANTHCFEQAVEVNILAGGDSAGRALMIGALLGAQHGIDGATGIPLDWVLQTDDNAAIWQECQQFSSALT